MKKTFLLLAAFYVLAIFVIGLVLSCNQEAKKAEATATGLPYTVQLEEYVNTSLPDLHSYSHAIYKDKIIMIGGRTNGLHGQSYNFFEKNSNKNVYVIDTKNWSAVPGWTVYSMPDEDKLLSVANINTKQLRANNAEFFTTDSTLYIVGGLLGSKVSTQLKNPNDPSAGLRMAKDETGKLDTTPPITLPYMTAINLPALINTVMQKKPMPSNGMRQVKDSLLAVTGGELNADGNKIYLVFGWDFSFANGDLYTHQIRTFTYQDDGTTLSISPITYCKTCWDGKTGADTAGNFRRRDGSMSVMIDPKDESNAMLYYSGVFKGGNTNFDSPVWIGQNTAAEEAFVMRSNVYTCQVIPAYSKSLKQAYATLLGGMKNANFTGGAITKPTALTAANAPIIATDSKNPFDHIPFSNQFSTIVVDSKHNYMQYLLPDSFPTTKIAYKLPASSIDSMKEVIYPQGSVAYNGSEAEMLWTLNGTQFSNGVIDYDAFIKANPKGGSVGYLHGGILSTLPNVFGAKAAHYSIASNRIFSVKIVPITK
jgi:hypothetical protein